MAKFIGSGTLNMSGGKIRDVDFRNGEEGSLRLSGNGPMEVSDVEFNGVTTGVTGNPGGAPAHNVTVKNARFVGVTTAIEPYGNNWNVEGCEGNIVTTFINSSAGHDYLRMAGCRTAGQINTNGTDRIVFEGNIYRGVIDLGTTVESVYISGVMENPGGTAPAIVQGTSVSGFTIDLQVYDGAGYDAPAFIDSQDGVIRGLYANVTGGVLLDGCTNVDVPAQIGGVGLYLGGHGVQLNDCIQCEVTGRIVEPGQDAHDTYDGVILTGASDLNFVHDATVVGAAASPQPRYAFNDETTGCNRIIGNNGDGQYASGNISPGANTVLDWPNDPLDGDNLFACPSGS